MLENWQNWCRLCAKIDSPNEDATYKAKSTADQLEIVNNFFGITLLPLERIESTTCEECCNFLTKLEHFGERCMKTDQMFRELMQKRTVSSTDLESIRCKYGIDAEDMKYGTQDEEEPHQQSRIFDQAGQYSDPLEMEIECSVVVKQEMSDEYVPVAKRQATEDNNLTLPRSAPNKKIYVVSYNQQKVYTVVNFCGEEPDYDDFVKAVSNKFNVQGITLYDDNEIQISRDAFKLVFEEIPPKYVIIKSSMSDVNIHASVASTSSDCNTNSSNPVTIHPQSRNPQQVVTGLRDYFTSPLNNTINGRKLLERKTLNDRERKLVIRTVCDHLHMCCEAPRKEDKIAWAEATIALFPCLRVDNPTMPYEAIYNPNNRGGFLGHRIKNMNISKSIMDKSSTEQTSDDEKDGVEEPNTEMRDMLEKLKPETDREKIMHYTDLTFDIRKKIVATEKRKIIHFYPRFVDTLGLIQHEFEKYHPGKGAKLKELFTVAFESKLMVLGRKSALSDDVNEWPSAVKAVISWLTLLKPTGCKAPRTVQGALDELLKFQRIVFAQYADHPYIIAQGDRKSSIIKYFVQVRGEFVVTKNDFIDALDIWFKAHIIFNLTQQHSLTNFFTYLKAYVFKIPMTGVPTTVSKCCLILNQEQNK